MRESNYPLIPSLPESPLVAMDVGERRGLGDDLANSEVISPPVSPSRGTSWHNPLIRSKGVSSIFASLLLLLTLSCQQTEKAPPPNPEAEYKTFFQQVQMAHIFEDSKTFADAVPRYTPEEILERYQNQSSQADFDLQSFISANYILPPRIHSDFRADGGRIDQHIERLWPVLTRKPDTIVYEMGSLIPLQKPYVVPGGRFREIYYWDSYFTMLGLQAGGKLNQIKDMVDNFAYLIDTYGYIPNGNRKYYLSRSQPPFFSLMVGLWAEVKGADELPKYLDILEKEYAFWMKGKKSLFDREPAHKRVVLMPDGSVLNRYWDDLAEPRPESFREDSLLAAAAVKYRRGLYRDLRAACESGWDFSSRWLRDHKTLGTIHTTEIIPIDLNCLMYHMERTLARMHRMQGHDVESKRYEFLAAQRKAALQNWCWNSTAGFYMDYDFVAKKFTGVRSLAGTYPLYFDVATPEQALSTARQIEQEFLHSHGLVSTLNDTGQQWDFPNGWAPLQWITIQGLRRYGAARLANRIKWIWIRHNMDVYKKSGKLVEKYNVVEGLEGSGGEYPNQDGFGWTNGVLLKLLTEPRVPTARPTSGP